MHAVEAGTRMEGARGLRLTPCTVRGAATSRRNIACFLQYIGARSLAHRDEHEWRAVEAIDGDGVGEEAEERLQLPRYVRRTL